MLTLDIEHGGRIYEVTGDGWELTGPGLDDLSIADQDAVGRKFDRLRLELQPVEATPGAASYEGWKQNRVGTAKVPPTASMRRRWLKP